MVGDGATADWYADPWGHAALRWWDGDAWTGHTIDRSALPPPPSDDPVSGATHRLAHLPTTAERLAVVDVETTGLYNSDRVVEVAIVTLDASGVVVDEFETLVNPGRDVGPTWIHQVTASMVRDAPAFDEVAHHVASRLDGAVCVAHNLRFDRRMLTNEFDRAGISVDWGVGLDTLSVTGCKLGIACRERGIEFHGAAHSALADARATAQLVRATASDHHASTRPVIARPLEVRPLRIRTRTGTSEAQAPAPYLAALAAGVHAPVDVAPYVDLLDRAIADLQATREEWGELQAAAEELGLDAARIARAHIEFVNAMIDAALEDLVITDGEYDQLSRAAALLGVDPAVVARRTDEYRAAQSEVIVTTGIRVCFTGAAVDPRGRKIERSHLEEIARSRGYVPTSSATKSGCDLLVAADPASQSGKAGKARQFGIPIVSVEDFLAAREHGSAMTATSIASAGTALVCSRCGGSWMAARRSNNPICTQCRAAERQTPQPTSEPPTGAATESLVCQLCGSTWVRPRSRGRKPSRCNTCH